MPEALGAFFSIITLLVGFILVLAAAYWATRFIGRRFEMGAQGTGAIRILDRVTVGPDKMICIVQAADKTLLVGVTSQRMDTLAELAPDKIESSPPSEGSPSFSDTFKSLLAQKTGLDGKGKEADKSSCN